jgi:hypothetical protein
MRMTSPLPLVDDVAELRPVVAMLQCCLTDACCRYAALDRVAAVLCCLVAKVIVLIASALVSSSFSRSLETVEREDDDGGHRCSIESTVTINVANLTPFCCCCCCIVLRCCYCYCFKSFAFHPVLS